MGLVNQLPLFFSLTEEEDTLFVFLLLSLLCLFLIIACDLQFNLLQRQKHITDLEEKLVNQQLRFETILTDESQSMSEKINNLKESLSTEKQLVQRLKTEISKNQNKHMLLHHAFIKQLTLKEKMINQIAEDRADEKKKTEKREKQQLRDKQNMEDACTTLLKDVWNFFLGVPNSLHETREQEALIKVYTKIAPDFYTLLNKIPHPRLTPYAQTVCILYHMGKSTHDIIILMGCSKEALRQCRYRIVCRIKDQKDLSILQTILQNRTNEV